MHFMVNILLLKFCLNIVENSDKIMLKRCRNLMKFELQWVLNLFLEWRGNFVLLLCLERVKYII
jgi:hypothetical protein